MLTLLILASLVGQTPEAKKAEKAEKAIPDDFKIVAKYEAGYSDGSWWTATITADGKAVQEINLSREARKEFQLSAEEVKDLLAAVKQAEFSKLPKLAYLHNASDQDWMVLEITASGKTHRVAAYGYGESKDAKNKAELKRFGRLWREILKKVPSPNGGDVPEDDDR